MRMIAAVFALLMMISSPVSAQTTDVPFLTVLRSFTIAIADLDEEDETSCGLTRTGLYTSLRSVLGQSDLDELLARRDEINQQLQLIIDEQTEPWGIKVSIVEVKDVELPDTMKRAMARQAEAEREKRAKIIHAEGEFQAAQRLSDAAQVMQREPATLQLRYLQTLTEIATEKNSTIVFPLPIDTRKPFLDMAKR